MRLGTNHFAETFSDKFIQPGTISELLRNDEFEQLAGLIQQAQIATTANRDPNIATLLTLTRHLCLALHQCGQELHWHQDAGENAYYRKEALEATLYSVLDLADELLRSPPSPTRLASPTESSGQRAGKANTHTPSKNKKGWSEHVRQLLPWVPVPTKSDRVITPTVTRTLPALPQRAEQQLVIYTLGTFQVYCNDELLKNWTSRKGLLIFKYLLLNRGTATNKERLMDVFWPDSTADAARNNLNVAIYGLRQTLRRPGSSFSHILFQEDHYLLNPELYIWLDYEEFFEAYQTAQRLEQAGDSAAALRAYQSAEMLYQGEFMADGLYEDWMHSQRQLLQSNYLSLLDKLSQLYLETNDYAACMTVCNKMLTVDPCIEEAHRQIMMCYSRQGQLYLAQRQYHWCVSALEENLEVPPSDETTALYDQLISGEAI